MTPIKALIVVAIIALQTAAWVFFAYEKGREAGTCEVAQSLFQQHVIDPIPGCTDR